MVYYYSCSFFLAGIALISREEKGPSLDVSKSLRTLSAVSCYSFLLFIHLLSPLDLWMLPLDA
jgi:hypothetical protein